MSRRSKDNAFDWKPKTLQNHLVSSFIIGLNFEAKMEAPILLLCQNRATYNLSAMSYHEFYEAMAHVDEIYE